MDAIITLPLIRLGNTLTESTQTEGSFKLQNIRYIIKHNQRLGDGTQVEFTKIHTRHGAAVHVPLPLIDVLKMFKTKFIGDQHKGQSFTAVPNIIGLYETDGMTYVETIQDRLGYNAGIRVVYFDGNEFRNVIPEDILHIWRMDNGTKSLIKNLKVASGGNV